MRLLYLDRGQLRLTEYLHRDIPPYAILSHRWGTTQDEVSYLDIREGAGDRKSGWAKLRFCGEQARKDDLKYFWVDTCCIDKGNPREVSRAIASMFEWYADAQQCYVYLADVTVDPISSRAVHNVAYRPWERAFRRSQWFTRGWTLQELLAPARVTFFSSQGLYLGSRTELSELIQQITGIDRQALHGKALSEYSEADRFRWAVNRQTLEPEDHAYSLLGIFGVSMLPYYGEGEDEAYNRLKEAIIRKRLYDLIKLDVKQGRRNTEDSEHTTLEATTLANDESVNRHLNRHRARSHARRLHQHGLHPF
ncbi:hypothetical protein AMS68_002096 [Peltaster fructicola]|uniref:Heterokaryon incompatibility domain-containing protein n=1 Tax=Peltaster fructicola TaxID=286661 RepID=A0A6H0XPN0_9PEZI|nr:hypothetical protein AMS68_002096 [Peltaster fructicola]